jgi:hypothetical protein
MVRFGECQPAVEALPVVSIALGFKRSPSRVVGVPEANARKFGGRPRSLIDGMEYIDAEENGG